MVVTPTTWWYYIDPDGNEVLLNNHEQTFFLEEEGCGLETIEPISQRVAYEHGQLVSGIYAAPRDILLRIGLMAEDDIAWRSLDNHYCRQLSPFVEETQVGTLRRVRVDGEVRDIGAWLVGYTKSSADREGPCYGERVLKFWCPDPFFYDPAPQEINYNLNPVGGLTYPITYPITFAESNINAHNDVYNAGDVKSWPSILIYGPLRNPAIENETTGETISIDQILQANDYLQVDMLNAVVQFYDDSVGETTEITSALTTDSVFWALRRGSNMIHFTALDVIGGGIVFQYHPRYQCI